MKISPPGDKSLVEINGNFVYRITDYRVLSLQVDTGLIRGPVHCSTRSIRTGFQAKSTFGSFNRKKALPLNDELLLTQLEELAERIGITVRYESMNGENSPGSGGLCRLKGEYILFIHSRATRREKIRVVTRALRQFDLKGIYLRPLLRELLDESEES